MSRRHTTERSTRVAHLTSVHQYNDPRIFHKQCHSLADAGFEVYLVAPVSEPKHENGVHVVPVGTWKNRTQRLLVTIPKVARAALRLRASVYHIHDPELLGVAQLLRLTGADVIYDIHEDYVTSVRQKAYLPGIVRMTLAFLLSFAESALSLGLRRIIAEKYYEERFPEALKILNYPIRSSAPEATVASGGGDPRFDPSYKWYLYTGNVTLDRGAVTQLNLLQANPKAAVCYVGHCSSLVAQLVREQAQALDIDLQRIVIIGVDEYVSRETIAQLTNSGAWIAGLALFPNTEHYKRKELTKFFEYMEAGLPILASDFPVWTNMIEGQIGFTVDPLDLTVLQERSTALEEDPELRRRFGEVGKQQVSQEYNWARQEEALVDLYKELVVA